MATIDEFRRLVEQGVHQRRHPRDLEHQLQVECIKWFRLQYPEFHNNLFAVPNGGRRDEVTAAKLRAEGVLAGVADLILLKSNDNYGALLIEMKTARGRQSEAQRQWQSRIILDGYKYVVCHSFDDFRREVTDYLSNVTTDTPTSYII